jgi:putative addiction module killer protein
MLKKQLSLYRTAGGKIPFVEWIESLDFSIRKRIEIGIDKLELGYMPDCKHLEGGVFEMRLHFGPGYRIYFGQMGGEIVILLCGGDKGGQKNDIKKAMEYWRDFNLRLK